MVEGCEKMQKIAEIVVLYILLLIISLPITACRFPIGRQYDDNAEHWESNAILAQDIYQKYDIAMSSTRWTKEDRMYVLRIPPTANDEEIREYTKKICNLEKIVDSEYGASEYCRTHGDLFYIRIQSYKNIISYVHIDGEAEDEEKIYKQISTGINNSKQQYDSDVNLFREKVSEEEYFKYDGDKYYMLFDEETAEESFVMIDNTMKSIEAKYQEIFRIPDNLCLYDDSPQYFDLDPEIYYYIYEDNNNNNELYVGEFGHYSWKATELERVLKSKK